MDSRDPALRRAGLSTIYPWYGDAAPDNIAKQMDWSWNNGLQQVKNLGKDILIAEIGWPSAGGGERSSPRTRPSTTA